MGDQEHGQPQGIPKRHNQPVECRGPDGIQAGSGFVQKQDFRIKGQGPCQARAFNHAAGEFGRVAKRRIGR